MKGFKDLTFADRLSEQAKAKAALLDKFKQRPPDDDPEVIAKREARAELLRAREERLIRKAEEKRIEEERKAEEARRLAEEKERHANEEALRLEELKREQKALRDQRYAARKMRKK